MSQELFENQVVTSPDLSGRTFFANTRFVRCTFPSKTSFRDCTFSADVSFENCHFLAEVDFTGAAFHGNFDASSVFGDTAYFDRSVFESHARFIGSHFKRDAYLRSVKFKWDVSFASTQFDRRLNLRDCSFNGYADFSDAICRGRVKFLGATFRDEVRFRNAQLQYLKNLLAEGVSLEGAILKEAHFHGITELKNYTFRDAFLLSCAFADKKLTNCDFTGAVMKAVLVDGWKPDRETLENTKYIYTDYEFEHRAEDGSPIRMIPRAESRVPLVGEFGAGDHEAFTLADFLATRYSWQISVNLPEDIRAAVLNYLNFFPDFLRLTDNSDVEIRTRREGGTLRLEFIADSTIRIDTVRAKLEQYLANVGRPFSGIEIAFKAHSSSDVQRELFMIRYEHQLNALQTELKLVRQLLLKEEEKNHLLLMVIDKFGRAPQSLFIARQPSRIGTDIYFLTADLKDYSKATKSNSQLQSLIQTFLFDIKASLLKNPDDCELVKLDGDGLKVFARDGIQLIWTARDIIHKFEALKKGTPMPVHGFRVVLGYGWCTKESREDWVDFAGDCIIETVRVAQPMKRYLEKHNLSSNQIWCTQAFHDQTHGRHDNISFDKLPPLELDKGYTSTGDLFLVTIR